MVISAISGPAPPYLSTPVFVSLSFTFYSTVSILPRDSVYAPRASVCKPVSILDLQIHGVRAKMVAIMEERFADLNIKFSVGGQISFDAFPVGWDKTFCLRYVVPDNYDEIHFFGDKTYKVRSSLGFRSFNLSVI